MRRLPWDILLALLAGIGLGLVYAWMISPLRITDADPTALRPEFKDHYRSAIAAAYAANGNLPRAQARISLLQEPDPVEALNAQAQRMLANGEPFRQTDQVAALALALEGRAGQSVPATVTATENISNIQSAFTETLPPSADVIVKFTGTPPEITTGATPADLPTSIPRPTQTPAPTQGAPFRLTGQDEVCDANLPEGLLQVIVLNASRRQLPGMQIRLTWDGGEEQFFTGLKAELGNGYADAILAPDVSYTVQLAAGSDIASGLVAPTCQTSGGENFTGGFKLTFQQP
jgi:hypothetical protein